MRKHKPVLKSTISVPRLRMRDLYADGKPLCEVWFDRCRSVTLETLERRRCKVLGDVARAVGQLHRYVFPSAGAPVYDEMKEEKREICSISS